MINPLVPIGRFLWQFQPKQVVKRFGFLNNTNNFGIPNATPQPMSTYVSNNQRRLVALSRQLLLKNDYGKQVLRLFWTNLIGDEGIKFQANMTKADNTLDKDLNDALEDAWCEWSEGMYCDNAGLQTFTEIQRLAVSSVVADGEAFIRYHVDEDSKFKLKLQILDAQRCSPVETNQSNRRTDPTALQNGIIFDRKTGKPLQYLFSDEWSNDQYYDDHSTPHRYDQIAAEELIHLFIPEQTQQRRGLPILHASLDRLSKLDRYEEAGLTAAEMGSKTLGFIGWDKEATPDIEVDLSENPIKTEAGSWNELLPGMNIQQFDSGYPSDAYDPYMMRMLHAVAMGVGVAYSSLTGDVADANFSSLRHAMTVERAHWKVLQGWLIKRMMTPIYKKWLMYQLRNGTITTRGRRLSLTDIDKCMDVSWTPRRWDWIDPRNEAIADDMAVKGLVKSPSEVIRERGGDPAQVFAQIGADIAQMEANGIPEEIILDTFSNQVQQIEVDDETEGTSSSGSNKKSSS